MNESENPRSLLYSKFPQFRAIPFFLQNPSNKFFRFPTIEESKKIGRSLEANKMPSSIPERRDGSGF